MKNKCLPISTKYKLFNPKEIYNYTYSPNLNNRCQIRKMRLRERAQSIKDKINSIIKSCTQEKPEDTFKELSKYFYWEFDDYQP